MPATDRPAALPPTQLPPTQARLDALGVNFLDGDLEAGLLADLTAVEAQMRLAVRSSYPFLAETSRHLVEAGGKRFRPLLVLLAARFGDPDSPGVVPAAVAIELTHLSTLYHDDVMDEAPIRRGTDSANARWTNTIAILTGDFLFARASEITADLGTEATRILARTIALLCEGQIRETVGPGEDDDPVEHYLRVVAEKTGSLIATSARLGAMLAGADDAAVAMLASYGEKIGIAFQLSDDLLDVVGNADDFGKTPGTDLREGIATLPTLLAARSSDENLSTVQGLLGAPMAEQEIAAALIALRQSSVVEEARAEVQRWADEARAAIAGLPSGPAKDALDTLAGVVVTRIA
ncbi:MAG: Polyprenyl synthetase [Frankiales bacterium]|nr:Polyprenyl synthetase [Frankiales bacterium]